MTGIRKKLMFVAISLAFVGATVGTNLGPAAFGISAHPAYASASIDAWWAGATGSSNPIAVKGGGFTPGDLITLYEWPIPDGLSTAHYATVTASSYGDIFGYVEGGCPDTGVYVQAYDKLTGDKSSTVYLPSNCPL
jgi:hypothetical protein